MARKRETAGLERLAKQKTAAKQEHNQVVQPANLVYGVNDKPPLLALFFLSLQHIILMSASLVLPILLVSEIGGTPDEIRAVVALSMIACGIGTIVQAWRWGIIGSGYLCPSVCGPNFFVLSLEAAWLGGLPLMRGMTIVAGVVEALFSRIVQRIKTLFPPEITGLVVLMVALGLTKLAISKFFGVNYEGEPIMAANLIVAAATLLFIVCINTLAGKKIKLYGVLIGMVFGYVLSVCLGVMTFAQIQSAFDTPWVAIPHLSNMFDITFKWSLLPICIIVSITGALKSFGNLILCEKVNNDNYKEPDMKRVANGLMADAIGTVASGALGGLASDTSASNVSLSSTTGATSKYQAYGAGALFIILAFFPKLTALLSIMPVPVMGAILLFAMSMMVVSGLQIILGSGMNTRKSFVIGIALLFGLSLDMIPALFTSIPPWMKTFFDSLTISTIIAVVLNQFLSVGEKMIAWRKKQAEQA